MLINDGGVERYRNHIKIQIVNSNRPFSIFPPALSELCEHIYNAKRDFRFKKVKRNLTFSYYLELAKEGKIWSDYCSSPPLPYCSSFFNKNDDAA